MALGGGTFTTQNKTLPGTYINFISKERANASVSDRGYAAMPMLLDWGPENQVITVTNEDFIKNSLKNFGYAYDADELKGLRDLFTNATTLYTYRLNGGGVKASNAFGTAKYGGSLGNSICNVVGVSEKINSTVSADDMEVGTMHDNTMDVTIESYVLNPYFSVIGEADITVENVNDTVGGTSFANVLKIKGKINSTSTKGIYNALKVEALGQAVITLYCANGDALGEGSTTQTTWDIGLYDENFNSIETVGVDNIVNHSGGNAITLEIPKKGTYYIGFEGATFKLYSANITIYDYNVKTIFNGETVEEQTVNVITDLESDYIDYDSDATLYETAGLYMTGGTDVTAASATAHQKALNALESYSFNTLGCISADDTIKKLYVEYTKRLRDESGIKFQTVVSNYAADYEGVINVANSVKDGESGSEIVYWVTGASAGCAVNKSLANTTYNGEYNVYTDYTQTELTALLKAGKFVLHKVGDDVRVLKDINSFVSTTKDKNEDFTLNQVIRVLDQIGNDVAVLFNDNYCGKVPNDKAGRLSLWNDIIKYCQTLSDIRAIEDFSDDDCFVAAGDSKTAVVVDLSVYPTCAMDTLYMTVYVR